MSDTGILTHLSHRKLPVTPLFFNRKAEETLGFVTRLLDEGHLPHITQRLEEKELPGSISCLFTGDAGTGKTAAALRIARLTGRDILLAAFGGKLSGVEIGVPVIREIFRCYRQARNDSKRSPILIMDSVDGVFCSPLADSGSAHPAGRDIRRALLDEMESLNGILICTTRRINRGDKAFYRGFNFHLRFSLPDLRTRQKIWRSRLPGLTREEALILARQFRINGGQVEALLKDPLLVRHARTGTGYFNAINQLFSELL